MSERKWPFLYKNPQEMSYSMAQANLDFIDWLKANLTEAELDRIAPKKCEHREIVLLSRCLSKKYHCNICGATLKPIGWEEVDGK